MDRKIINIKEEDIGNWNIPIPSNGVIVEITERSIDKVTKGGIYIGHHEDVVFAEGEGSHEADVAEVWGTLVAQPEELYYNKSYTDYMPWETAIETKPGDTVWFEYMASVNCDVLVWGKRRFYVLKYSDLYVAKRGEEIIPLNGFCLCEPIKEFHDSKLAEGVTDRYRTDVAIVRHIGRPNDNYLPTDNLYGTYFNDKIDVQEGDEVILRRGYPLSLLERLDGIATFSDQPYYVIQRRFMEMVIDENQRL